MLSLRGVPGIYFHSLFGSRNWKTGVEQTKRYRTINREKLDLEKLERELDDPNSLRYRVFNGFRHMLDVRKKDSAFHPLGGQQILDVGPSVFALLRTAVDGSTQTLCLLNITNRPVQASIDLKKLPIKETKFFTDIIMSAESEVADKKLEIMITPYQVCWLKPT